MDKVDKDIPEKPLLPPPPEEATKRMWETTNKPEPARPVVDAGEAPEVKCDYCGSMVRIRRGQRCPVCAM